MPAPNPPGTGNQPPPNAAQQAPAAAPAQPPAPPRPAAWDIACRLGDRTGQPERHHPTFRHHRDRPRDHVGQRRSHQPSGAYGLRRHVRLLQRPRPAMAVQHAVPQPRRRSVQDDQRAEWRCLQPILRLTGMGAGPFQADHQQHQVGANGEGNHSDRRHLRRESPIRQLHVHQELGQRRPWTTNFSAIAVSPDNGEHWGDLPRNRPHARGGPRPGVPYVAGNEKFQMGAFLGPGLATVTSTRSGHRPDAAARRLWREFPRALCRTSPNTNTGTPTRSLGPEQSGGRHAGDPGPGGRDVGPIQHLSQAIPGAVLQRCQRRRGKDCAGSARTVGSRATAREVMRISPAASTRRTSIPGRQVRSCTSICRCGRHTT